MRITKGPKPLKETVSRRDHAHIGAHWLHDHSSHLVFALCQKFFHTFKIIIHCDHGILRTALGHAGAVGHTAGHDSAACTHQHGIRVAVIASCKFDDLSP